MRRGWGSSHKYRIKKGGNLLFTWVPYRNFDLSNIFFPADPVHKQRLVPKDFSVIV